MKVNFPLSPWPLQELRLPISCLLLLGLPAVAGFLASYSSRTDIFQIVFPYVVLVGCLAGGLEVKRSRKTQVGGASSIAPVLFRNVSHAGFLIVAGLIVGVLAGFGWLQGH